MDRRVSRMNPTVAARADPTRPTRRTGRRHRAGALRVTGADSILPRRPRPSPTAVAGAGTTTAARDLPWRRAGDRAWAVLVSEVMLQQTPVARVMPAYEAGWPVADAGRPGRRAGRGGDPRRGAGSATRAGRCGCTRPRPAIVERHGGEVPADAGRAARAARASARTRPGRWPRSPTASGTRWSTPTCAGWSPGRCSGQAEPARRRPPRDLVAVEALLPADPARAARASVALMELGALVCTARAPPVRRLPVAAPSCAWRRGRPPGRTTGRYAAAAVRRHRPAGPRAAAGVLRAADGSGPATALDAASGPSRPSGTGRWTGWSPTAWSTRWPTATFALPHPASGLAPAGTLPGRPGSATGPHYRPGCRCQPRPGHLPGDGCRGPVGAGADRRRARPGRVEAAGRADGPGGSQSARPGWATQLSAERRAGRGQHRVWVGWARCGASPRGRSRSPRRSTASERRDRHQRRRPPAPRARERVAGGQWTRSPIRYACSAGRGRPRGSARAGRPKHLGPAARAAGTASAPGSAARRRTPGRLGRATVRRSDREQR